jgi:hypothetical protein
MQSKPKSDRGACLPVPLRYREADDFLESARDMGDPAVITAAIRFWNATYNPRNMICTGADIALFHEWRDNFYNA